MSTTNSPNMGLVVPGVGTEQGPDWAQEINADLSIIDSHNHSTGQGVQITPSGLNINSDLTFQSNNATNLKTVRFLNLSASLAGSSPNLGCLYESLNELYYNDGVGNVVKITNSGNVNAGAGSITGLPSGTASASFSSSTFVWQSATNTPAIMDMGSIIVRNTTVGAHGVTITPVNSLGADYNLVLPALPASQKIMTLDSSGNMGAPYVVDGSTVIISSNVIQTGLPVVQASSPGSTALSIIRLLVGSGGGLIAGEGATVALAGTGIYDITFDTPFSDTPVVVGSVAGGTPVTIGCPSRGPASCTINAVNSGGSVTNVNFDVIIMGHK